MSGCAMDVPGCLKACQQIGGQLQLIVRKITQECAIREKRAGQWLQYVTQSYADKRRCCWRDIEAMNLQRFFPESLMLTETGVPGRERNIGLLVCLRGVVGKELWPNSHEPSLAELSSRGKLNSR